MVRPPIGLEVGLGRDSTEGILVSKATASTLDDSDPRRLLVLPSAEGTGRGAIAVAGGGWVCNGEPGVPT
jgi:hypothetical protein